MSRIETIFALTESVEQHVERGEWAAAGALDVERCRLLAELIDGAAPAERAGLRQAVEQLLLRNRLTVDRLSTRREALEDEAARFERNAVAMRSYSRNAADADFVPFPQARVEHR